jgi:translation initiation factor 2B subunit (eIF-2B alpha/beta/delta family)
MAENTKLKTKTKLVKGNFQLLKKQDEKTLADYVLDELKDLDLTNLKLDPEFLKYLAELIENQVKKSKDKDTKPNKMDILISILKKLFPKISEQELDIAKNIVEFLLKNDMIKKIGVSKVMTYYLNKKFFGTSK